LESEEPKGACRFAGSSYEIFTQGDAADAVFYIQEGKVRLTVVSEIGKEATLGILSEGEFFGEGGLAGQPLRMGSATAMTDCELLQIDKKAMICRAPPGTHVL
jgi:CRP-like cAMP-binding protein